MKKSEIKPADSYFIKAGGVWQPRVANAQDMLSLLQLDDALWQCTSLPLDALRCEPVLLNILDLDGNRQIRTDEIKAIISWTSEVFNSFDGFEFGSDVLKLSDISGESDDGKKIREAGRTVLQAIGRDEEELSIQELLNDQQIRNCAGSNGDGIIVPDMEKYPGESRLIKEIIRVTGGTADLSGQTGINSSQLADFCQQAEQAVEWFTVDRQNRIDLLPYGDETMLLLGLHTDLAPAINGYFQSAGAMKFLQDDPERIKNKKLSADLRSLAEVEELLGNMTFAAPSEDGKLHLDSEINPKYAKSWAALLASAGFQQFIASDRTLSAGDWENFSLSLKPCLEHQSRKPANFSGDETDALPEILQFKDSLSRMITEDESAGMALSGSSLLLKAAVLQKYLLDFLNNFANLSELLTPGKVSMLQYGKLIMDGRHFTLAVPVKNLAAHKKIAATSHICTAYVEISRDLPDNADKHLLAVAITNGSMKRLFVGKKGVFFGADEVEYSASVIDFIEQPVSLSDALKSPFSALGSFIGKQFEKILAMQSGDAQKNLDKQFAQVGKTPAPGAGAPNTSMLLLGGSLGVAAIGSSIAFIAKSLQNVSVMTVIWVILGIMLIFGGPVMINAVIKLCRRDLGRFIEAAGCALNHHMRLSFALGRVFTFTPKLSEKSKYRAITEKNRSGARWLLVIIIILVVMFLSLQFFLACHQSNLTAFIRYLIHQIRL